jgi:hypothetical protein
MKNSNKLIDINLILILREVSRIKYQGIRINRKILVTGSFLRDQSITYILDIKKEKPLKKRGASWFV